MPEVYVVRAFFGTFIRQFLSGGYVAVGWMNNTDLTGVTGTEKLTELYQAHHPEIHNSLVLGQQVGQIERFLFEMKSGDFVITPDKNSELIYYGVVQPRSSYYYFQGKDGCPYRHRRKVIWIKNIIKDKDFSAAFQHTIRSPLIVFHVPQEKNSIRISDEGISFG